jgi:uncharacterized protein (DUF169 family)
MDRIHPVKSECHQTLKGGGSKDMTSMRVFHESAKEIRKLVLLKTLPVAIKLLEKDEDIPEGAKRPVRDLGHHLALCQGFSMSRREGASIAMLKEDMWCFPPVIGFGLAEPPSYFLEGHAFFPTMNQSLEAAKNRADAFPRLKTGKYTGIISAPLETTTFEPDWVMIYCDSAQLRQLLLTKVWKDGTGVKTVLTAGAACVWSLVPAILSGDYQVAVPCLGDQRRAMAQDDELIFTIPKKNLEDIVSGLKHLDKQGSGFPQFVSLTPEYSLFEEYVKVGRMMGMEWLR